jgi:T5SS/PEP-CTERM-associated repeat protein
MPVWMKEVVMKSARFPRPLRSAVLALLSGACIGVPNGTALADDVYWVGYQNDVLGPNYPDVGSFFHADNWLNYTVPGAGDTAIFGSSIQNPNNPGHRPHLLYFGNFNLRIPGQGDQFIPGGDAEVGRLEVHSDEWVFDFGSGSGNGAPLPPHLQGSLHVGDDIRVGSTRGNASLTFRNGNASAAYISVSGYGGTSGTLRLHNANLDSSEDGVFDIGVLGGRGYVVIEGASGLHAGYMRVGENGDSNGQLEVSGPNASVVVRGMQVGATGQGAMIVRNGALLRSTEHASFANFGAESLASFVLTGIGSRAEFVAGASLGVDGAATASIQDGASMTAHGLRLGTNGGTGTLTLSDGGSLALTNQLSVGASRGGEGTLHAFGEGTAIDAAGTVLAVGELGALGRMDVSTGARVQADVINIGFLGDASAPSWGSLHVDGQGSSVEAVRRINVGVLDAYGALSITNGAHVSSRATVGFPGFQAGGLGTADVEVRGAGSLLQSDQGIVLGDGPNGVATFVLADNASVISRDEGINVGYAGRGTLSIESGGTASSRYARIARTTGSVGNVVVSGTGSTWSVTDNLFVGGHTATGEGGNGTLTVRDGGALTVARTIETWSSGTIDTSVTGRVLVGSGDIALVSAGTLAVGTGGTLAGSGTIIGDVLNLGGTISPGHSPGTLAIDGNLFLGNAGTLDLEIGGPGTGLFDVLCVSGSGLLAGTLRLSFIDGYVPSSIFSIDVVTAGGQLTGSFNDIQLIGVDPSLVSTSFRAGAFSVNVVPAPGGAGLALLAVSAGVSRRRR